MEYEIFRQTFTGNFAALAERVDQLILLCEQLAQENQRLRAHQAALQTERDNLLQQHAQSRARIEAIVARLRGLEKLS